MRNMIKIGTAIVCCSALLSHVAFANKNSPQFSPYADLTLNVHWDSQYQDLVPMDLLAISKASGTKNFTLAFITDSGSCVPAWGGQSAYSVEKAWGSHLLDDFRKNNIGYTVSFGGASGNDLSLACGETQLITAIEQVLTTYQPQGIDFDIENGTANVPKLMRALKQVQSKHQNIQLSFTLPVLPSGLVDAGKDIINQAKAQDLNFAVNIMAMDYGPSFMNAMGGYAIEAASNLFNFLKSIYPGKSDADLWKMLIVTPMIGVNDVNIEEFSLKDADILRQFVSQNKLGGLSMWSINRDFPCSDKSASTNCSGNNLQSKPYAFSQHLNI